jgi:hypothetical protein
MENKDIKQVENLLRDVKNITEKYEEYFGKTGLKYNIFSIAGIDNKEVMMCRVIADLLNPNGKHFKKELYLNLFLETLKEKEITAYNFESKNAKVSTEYFTNKGRRIDIVVEGGNIFIPIEVKIHAGDQENQIKDYFEYAQTRNAQLGNENNVPVMYLTLDGHQPNGDICKSKYQLITWREHILSWLNKCLVHVETVKTASIHEIICQFIVAVKSLCNIPEEENMKDEILDLVIKSRENIESALYLKYLDIEKFIKDRMVAEFIKVTEHIKKYYPNAEFTDEDDNWYGLCIPIRKGKYKLYIHCEWHSRKIIFSSADTNEYQNNMREAQKLREKIKEKTGYTSTHSSDQNGQEIWYSNQIKRKDIYNYNNPFYYYELYNIYHAKAKEIIYEIKEFVKILEED